MEREKLERIQQNVTGNVKRLGFNLPRQMYRQWSAGQMNLTDDVDP